MVPRPWNSVASGSSRSAPTGERRREASVPERGGAETSPLPLGSTYGRSARIARTSAPSETVEVKKLMTSLPEMVSRPM
jgi:hypothetical protein